MREFLFGAILVGFDLSQLSLRTRMERQLIYLSPMVVSSLRLLALSVCFRWQIIGFASCSLNDMEPAR